MLDQRAEERRQQVVQVVTCRARHLACQKRHGVLVQIEQSAQLVEVGHGFGRCVLDGHLLAQGEDRQLRCPAPGHTNEFDHVLQQPLIFSGALRGDEDARQAMMCRGDDAPFRRARRGQDVEAILLELCGDATDALAGDRIGLDVPMDDQHGEIQFFVHGDSS